MREGDELVAGSGLTRDERRRDPSRVLALTDGVYAIIITLLVLDIHVPELSAHETLGAAISEVRPSFIGFTIAFIVAAMQWVGHRDLFTLIRDTDRGIGQALPIAALIPKTRIDSNGLYRSRACLDKPRVRCGAARRTLGTTLGPHGMRATERPARRRTQRRTVTPPMTSQNG